MVLRGGGLERSVVVTASNPVGASFYKDPETALISLWGNDQGHVKCYS